MSEHAYCRGGERGLEYVTRARVNAASLPCFRCGREITVTLKASEAEPFLCACGAQYVGESRAREGFVAIMLAKRVNC